jgi:protein-S-isoprenylcysteine O-methyltransferase Ste14
MSTDARRRLLETRVPPPIVTVLLALAMWAANRLVPGVSAAGAPRTVVAGGLFALAFLVAWSGIRTFARGRTSFDPHHPEKASALVTGGIFRMTRNPMYLSMALALLGWAVRLGRPWLVLGPVGFVLYLNRFQIRPEERALAEKFGPAYEDYRRCTRRWL